MCGLTVFVAGRIKAHPLLSSHTTLFHLHNHLNGDDGTANCQLSGYGAVGPAPRFAVIFAPSGSEVGCSFRIRGIPVPGLPFIPICIPTLVIIYGAAGGKPVCVHSCVVVVGEWKEMTESYSLPHGKGVLQGSLGRVPDGEVRCLGRSVEASLLMSREI